MHVSLPRLRKSFSFYACLTIWVNFYDCLALMLLVAILANAVRLKKPENPGTWVLICPAGTVRTMYVHCTNCTYNVRTLYVKCPLGESRGESTQRELSPMNVNITRFRCFSKSLRLYALDESSLSIGRVNAYLGLKKIFIL